MKNNKIFSILLTCAFAAILVSCSVKDPDELLLTAEEGYVTFVCDMASDATKTAISDAGSTPTPIWQAGDGIFIRPETSLMFSTNVTLTSADINPADQSRATFRIKTTSSSTYYDALYPSSAFTTEVGYPAQLVATVPPAQKGTFGSGHVAASRSVPSTAGTYGFFFSNITNFIEFTLDNDDYSRIVLKGNDNEIIAGPVCLDLSGDKPAFTRYESSTYHGSTEVSLDISGHSGKTYYIGIIPTNFEYGFTLLFYKAGSRNADGEIAVSKRADFSGTSKIYNLGLIDGKISKALPEGALRGRFSVSDTRQVYFSCGNLVYSTLTGLWSFKEPQYDVPRDGEVSTEEITLHCWGYDDEKSTDPYGQYTIPKDGQFSDKYDWGWALQPSDPWRTPSYDDWEYLFNTRVMTYGKPRYTKTAWDLVKIDGIAANGIFIYPDDFNGKLVDESGSTWTWSGLKNAGIVFLPENTIREGAQYINAGGRQYYGGYWTSLDYTDDYAYAMKFNTNSGPFLDGLNRKDEGFGVRLIVDCE